MKRFLDCGASSSSVTSLKKKTTGQTFRESYKQEWPCFKPSAKGPNYAFCSTCRVDICIAHAGRDDCRRHVASKKHSEYTKLLKDNVSVASMFKSNSEETENLKVMRAEAFMIDQIVDMNLPISSADSFSKTYKVMFPDSVIAKKFSCARTKTSAVLDHMAKVTHQSLKDRLKNQPFTISTDGSNDSKSKLYPVVVRTFDEVAGEVRSDLLSVPECKDSATGENIFKLLDAELQSNNIPWTNCLSLGCDNANVMTGMKKGVFAFVKKEHKSVALSGCVCHLIHIAAEKAASCFPFSIDNILVNIFYYLDKSSKRQTNLAKLQEVYNTEQRKILKHVPTRWLSVGKCLSRILSNWDALKEFFSEELKNAAPSQKVRLEELKKFFRSPTSKLYCLYLSHIITVFEKINTELQTEIPMVHKLHRKLQSLLRELLTHFVKPSAMLYKSVLDVDFTLLVNKKSDGDLVIGQAAMDFISHKEAHFLRDEKISEFHANVKLFLQTACIYLKKKLPFEDEVLKRAEIADPQSQLEVKVSDLRFFYTQFPVLIQHSTIDQLHSEFALYQSTDITKAIKDRVDHTWVEIGKLCAEGGSEGQFQNLSKFMLGILTLPHSSAHCERIFSMVRKNRTDFRSNMGQRTLQNLLVLKSRPDARKSYSDEQLKAMKKACTQALSSSQSQ